MKKIKRRRSKWKGKKWHMLQRRIPVSLYAMLEKAGRRRYPPATGPEEMEFILIDRLVEKKTTREE